MPEHASVFRLSCQTSWSLVSDSFYYGSFRFGCYVTRWYSKRAVSLPLSSLTFFFCSLFVILKLEWGSDELGEDLISRKGASAKFSNLAYSLAHPSSHVPRAVPSPSALPFELVKRQDVMPFWLGWSLLLYIGDG